MFRGPQLPWQPRHQSQSAVTCPVTRSRRGVSLTCTAWHAPATLLEPASLWVAPTESWERTRCQDDPEGSSFLVILPNRSPHAGGASHQLRGHPSFLSQDKWRGSICWVLSHKSLWLCDFQGPAEHVPINPRKVRRQHVCVTVPEGNLG